MTTTPRLVDELVRRALGVTITVLALVGLGTAALLHWRAHTALDAALLAAAEAHTVPHKESSAYSQDGMERVYPVAYLKAGHPAERWRSEVLGRAEPVIHELGGVRYLLIDVASRHGSAVANDLEHAVIVAWGRDVTLTASVGPFLLVYTLLATFATWLARSALLARLGVALAPLHRAADDVRRVIDLGDAPRVDEQGPPEVQTLLHAVNDLLARLEHAFSLQARFTADAAHELRSPVAALRGELEITLRRPRDADSYRAALERALHTAEDLGELVASLLMLSRLDSGLLDESRTCEPLSAIATRALTRTRPLLYDAGITLSVHVAADPPLDLHPVLVEHAVSNLLTNLARHAPHSTATITIDADANYVSIDVADDGPGIAAQVADTIFHRFRRAPGHGDGGLGLGLSIARDVARRHGGDCVLLPSDRGAHFHLRLARRHPHSNDRLILR